MKTPQSGPPLPDVAGAAAAKGAPSRVRAALRACAYVAAAAALVALVRATDLRGVAATLRDVGPLAALALVPLGLQIVLEAFSWRLLLGRLGHRVALALSWRVNVQAEAIRLGFPGGPPLADAMRAVLFGRVRAIPLRDAAAALVARKLCQACTQGVYLGAAVALGAPLFERWARSVGPAGRALPLAAWAAAIGLASLSALAAWTLSRASLASRAEPLLARLTPGRLASALEARRASLAAVEERLRFLLARSPRTLSWNLLTGLGGWLLDAAETLLLLRLMGAQVGPGQALGVEALVSLVRILAFAVPGGLGIQDLTYHALLQGTVSEAAAVSLILLKRGRDVFWVAAGFGLPPLLDRLFLRPGPPREAAHAAPAIPVVGEVDAASPTPPSPRVLR